MTADIFIPTFRHNSLSFSLSLRHHTSTPSYNHFDPFWKISTMATSTSSSSSSSSHSSSLPRLSLSSPTESRFAPLSPAHSAESVDAYPCGDYYPVRIGEWLYQGQYQIIRKLGSGASSTTVWLAKDFLYVRGFLPLFH